MSDYRNNHYVPEWYQSKFIPAAQRERKFFYLDLSPEVRKSGDHTFTRADLLRWGHRRCFAERDLYTTFFRSYQSTDIEKKFFGRIDSGAPEVVSYFDNFDHTSADGDALDGLMTYMVLQKLRTPKGLRAFADLTATEDRNRVLIAMQRFQRLYGAAWSECIWAIADASHSPTKFLVSDHPVTVYNPGCFPGSPECRGHRDPNILCNGTHTIFPLSLNKVLILTNVSWIRNPYGNPLQLRPHPELMRSAMFNFTAIQTGRFLSEAEVREINHVIKSRAYRYVAAAEKDWLYPERYLRHTHWDRLGGGYLFFPDPRSVAFSGEIMAGWGDGHTEAWDEYGRRPGQPGFGQDAKLRNEWATAQAFKGEYARVFGAKRRGMAFDYGIKAPSEFDSDQLHESHLRSELHGKPKERRTVRRAKDIQ